MLCEKKRNSERILHMYINWRTNLIPSFEFGEVETKYVHLILISLTRYRLNANTSAKRNKFICFAFTNTRQERFFFLLKITTNILLFFDFSADYQRTFQYSICFANFNLGKWATLKSACMHPEHCELYIAAVRIIISIKKIFELKST